MIYCCFCMGTTTGQGVDREVFCAAGGSAVSGAVWVSQTIGEPMGTSFEGVLPGSLIVQGFEQPAYPLKPLPVCADTQTISLNPGWNMVSSYIDPVAPAVLEVIGDASADIFIIKNSAGAVTVPSIGLDLIGQWSPLEGYLIRAATETAFDIGCTQLLPEETPIPLRLGWSMIAYLRDDAMDVSAALAGLSGSLMVAKNNTGNVYLPALSLNTLGNMEAGQGYQVKLSGADTLLYPPNTGRTASVIPYTPAPSPVRLSFDGHTGSNATVVFPLSELMSLQIGDEIGVFNRSDQLCGAAVYAGRPLAIAVWGSDDYEGAMRYMQEGEPYRLKLSRAADGRLSELQAVPVSGLSYFTGNGLTFMKVLDPGEGLTSEGAIRVYPNPCTKTLTIEFAGFSQENMVLTVFDLSGAAVLSAKKGSGISGQETWPLDVSSLSPGPYVYRISAGNQHHEGRFTKVE